MTDFEKALIDNKELKVSFDRDYLNSKDERMEEILRRAGSDALDSTPIIPIKIESANSHICLIPLYDIHMFGEGFNLKRFQLVCDYLMNVSNACSFIGGDWYDNANKDSKTNVFNSKTNVSQALDGGEYLLSRIRDKILFILGGNHDAEFGDRVRANNISPAKESAKKIAPYIPYNALLNIKLKDKEFSAFATHGSIAKDPDALSKKTLKMCQRYGVVPDLIFSGHVHTELTFRFLVSVPVTNRDGIVTGYKTKNVSVEVLPSFQGNNEYATSLGYNNDYTNAIAYDIAFEKNPCYTQSTQNTEFEYMLRVTKFPVLKKMSNEYTSFAKEYMEMYHEPDKEKLKEEIADKLEEDKMQKALTDFTDALNDLEREM